MSAPFNLLGLHHVTATVDDAQQDLDFCLGGLGLRLVKKTVNFDNPFVYHFYYGDTVGSPGTLWTTFPYKDRGVREGVHGAGQITATAFAIPPGTLPTWKDGLVEHGVPIREVSVRFGSPTLSVEDPSGLVFDLVEAPDDPRTPWVGPNADASLAIRGLHSVSCSIRTRGPTLNFLTGFLGLSVVDEADGRTRLAVGGGTSGQLLDIVHTPDAPGAVNGLGTVHHVALAVPDAAAQLRLREALVSRGHQVTPVMDRQYFTSIYFREPGGVLLEVATAGPGFLIDEPVESLGRGLKLPPWEERQRSTIEVGLAPVQYA